MTAWRGAVLHGGVQYCACTIDQARRGSAARLWRAAVAGSRVAQVTSREVHRLTRHLSPVPARPADTPIMSGGRGVE